MTAKFIEHSFTSMENDREFGITFIDDEKGYTLCSQLSSSYKPHTFPQTLPIRYPLHTELSWTHYRCLTRIFDQHQKEPDDNPTIGLIHCSDKSEAVAKYSVLTDGRQLFASKYLPFLPSEEELRRGLERERRLLSEDE